MPGLHGQRGTATDSAHEEVRGRDRLRGDRREIGKRRRPQEQAHHRRIQLQRRAVEGQREARSNGQPIRRLLHDETRRHALSHRKQVRHERLRDPEAEQLTYEEREPHPGRMADSREITSSHSLAHWLSFIWDCRWVFLHFRFVKMDLQPPVESRTTMPSTMKSLCCASRNHRPRQTSAVARRPGNTSPSCRTSSEVSNPKSPNSTKASSES